MIFSHESDIGCGRSINEDYLYIPKENEPLQNVAIIADGMGGYNCGEVASCVAVESALEYLSEYRDSISQNCVRSAIRFANNRILEMSKSNPDYKDMGTTMTVAAFNKDSVVIGHVGDSRAYLISKETRKITQLTKDHSYVQMLIDNGEITIEEAMAHPQKNVITRAVGVEKRVKIDTFERTLYPGDIIVLCSDGLTKFVTDEEILDHISDDYFEGVSDLIKLVKEREGDDNISLITACNEEIIFDDRYKVVRQIGSGGMAKVFCAIDTKDNNKYVTIKLLKDECFTDEKIREMFKKEAEVAYKLKHKNIINAQRIVEEENRVYIVLDYIEGTNLKNYIEKNGPMDEKSAVNVGIQVAYALRYAHNSGYIHKDVKPQNIIIDDDMNAYLTDFGLATRDDEGISRFGDVVLGSVFYFSPEHAKGENVNARSDIYSLGIVLYELLCGKLPFDGDSTHEVIMGHLHNEPVPPNEYNRNISVAISQVILKAIDKDCELRYVNFNSFITDMKMALNHPVGGFVEYKRIPLTVVEHSFSVWKMAVSVFAILSLFFFLLIIGFAIFDKDDTNVKYGMPDLVNSTLVEAEAELESLGIEYRIEYYETNDISGGIVIDQSILANTDIPDNATVVLGVSTNSKDRKMPSLYRMHRDDAVAFLNSSNITNIVFEYIESDLPYNFVVSHTPTVEASMQNVNTVTLRLSNNHKTSYIPDLLNRDLSTAKMIAEEYGFDIGIVYEESDKSQTINRQLPISGNMNVEDLSIDVWIGERNNKNVYFNKDIALTIKEDGTKVVICYEEDGIIYYVNEFVLNVGIHHKTIDFYACTDSDKKIHIYFNNVKQNVAENVKAVTK